MRITPKNIDAAIRESRFDVHDRRLTVCVLTLQNGFLVTGESSCNNPADFDLAKGRAFALERAREKVGALLAYTERERQVTRPLDVQEAVTRLSREFARDTGFAWSWHCNIAMAFQDAATDAFMAHDAPRLTYAANDAAARFMKQAFGAAGYAPGSRAPAQGGAMREETPSERGARLGREIAARAAIQRGEQAGAKIRGAMGVDWSKVNAPPAVTPCILANGCHRAPACSGGCEALPKVDPFNRRE